MACKMAKLCGLRLPLIKVRAIISQENWDLSSSDPSENDSDRGVKLLTGMTFNSNEEPRLSWAWG